jgi:predicted site-specific integrase-resolvase
MQEFPEIMGMGDVMQYLKVSRQYIDRLVEQGKLRCKQTSTGKVFLFSDVAAFQKQRELKAKKRKH